MKDEAGKEILNYLGMTETEVNEAGAKIGEPAGLTEAEVTAKIKAEVDFEMSPEGQAIRNAIIAELPVSEDRIEAETFIGSVALEGYGIKDDEELLKANRKLTAFVWWEEHQREKERIESGETVLVDSPTKAGQPYAPTKKKWAEDEKLAKEFEDKYGEHEIWLATHDSFDRPYTLGRQAAIRWVLGLGHDEFFDGQLDMEKETQNKETLWGHDAEGEFIEVYCHNCNARTKLLNPQPVEIEHKKGAELHGACSACGADIICEMHEVKPGSAEYNELFDDRLGDNLEA